MLAINIIPRNDFDIFLLTIGGLSIFLFGLSLTRENLKELGNSYLEKVIQKSTNTKLKAFIVGFISTVLIQSSSGVTAIVVTFIACGYLTYPQGLGIMIGANLGTCVTAFLVGINIQEWSLTIIIIATVAICIFKKNSYQLISSAILGIGFLFLGLQFMEEGFKSIVESDAFSDFIIKYSNNSFFALLFGIILTFIIQSSSAIIGILEQLYAAQIITLQPALALMLGSNIGTTLTGAFVVINTNRETKKAVVANIIFNVIGVIIFLFILIPFTNLISTLEMNGTIATPQLAIAMGHLIFNFVTVILAYIFFDYLIKLTDFIYGNKLFSSKQIKNHSY
jgi:phosphate:Na+ symporter